MAFTKFTWLQLKEHFGLRDATRPLFPSVTPVEPSAWLQTTLALAATTFPTTEKERSERIISPILLEMHARNKDTFAFFSGIDLTVDKKRGLSGECDFILSNRPTRYLEAAIVGLVEAKKNDIDVGVPQCVAQMLAARIFNAKHHSTIQTIYGCVTTAEAWQFLMLEGEVIILDSERYYIKDIPTVLGVLQSIIDSYKGQL
jgi:hypothetical protein